MKAESHTIGTVDLDFATPSQLRALLDEGRARARSIIAAHFRAHPDTVENRCQNGELQNILKRVISIGGEADIEIVKLNTTAAVVRRNPSRMGVIYYEAMQTSELLDIIEVLHNSVKETVA